MKGAIAAAVGLPMAAILLIGGAMSSTTAPPTTSATAPVAYPSALPGPAQQFTGASTRCSIPDPTGTGGCVTPAMAWLLNQATRAFGSLPTSCWDEHAWNPTSDHPLGKGCDVTFGTSGAFPGPADTARGWLFAEWLRANATALRVSYVIWAGQIWSTTRDDEGWRPYTGGGVYDATDPTGGHYDHVHVSTLT